MKKYLVMRRWNDKSVGDIINLDSESPHTQRHLLTGFIELVKGPFGLEQKGLRLRVCEYQKRILKGEVMPGEIVFLRGVVPPTIARIRSRDKHSNAFLVNMGAGRDAFMVDFDPIDWSLYWVDSGLKIQRWKDLKEGYVYQIAEGNYPHRPGADEAAERECERRRQARKRSGVRRFDVGDVEVTVGGHKVTGIDPKFLDGKAPTGLPVYDKHGLVIDDLAQRRRVERLDRQVMREKIATRIGVSTRHISEDSINYELAIKGAARVASNLAEKRAPENDRMGRQMRDADIMGFMSSRFKLFDDPKIDHASHEVSLFVLFDEVEVDVTFGVNLQRGGWHWSSGERDDVWSTTLAMACDNFEAWVRDQFVEEEPAAPREVVTRHIGTADMGGRGTGGHR